MIDSIKFHLWCDLTSCMDETDCNIHEWRAAIDAWYDVEGLQLASLF